MGFREGSFAKVWEIKPKSDVNTQLRISISKKNKQTGEYEQDFSGFVSCIGKSAAKKAVKLKEGDRIRLKDVDVSTSYDREKKIQYVNYKCFDFLTESEDGFNAKNNSLDETAVERNVDDGEPDSSSDLPF